MVFAARPLFEPENSKSFEQGNAFVKPPLSVFELNDTITLLPSLLNIAVAILGVGGSWSWLMTVMFFACLAKTTVYSEEEGPCSSTFIV